MRYRIIIEVDTEDNERMGINGLAMEMKDLAVTSWCNPVYVATEVVDKYANIYSLPKGD